MAEPRKNVAHKKKTKTLDMDSLNLLYEGKIPIFKHLEQEALFILQSEIQRRDIKVHSITSRVKEVESFIEKVQRKQYSEPFKEIEDAVGLRIVCLFLSDIPRIGEVLRESFTVDQPPIIVPLLKLELLACRTAV